MPDSLQAAPAAVKGFPQAVRQANPRTRLILGIGGILLAIVLAWWITGLLAPAPKPHVPAAPVEVAQVGRKTVTVSEHTIGTIVANATVQVTAQVSGQIVSVNFKEGDIVHQGDTLFQLDPRPFKAALDQATANMNRDQATLVSDQKDAIRYTTLQKLGAVASQQTDQAVAAAKAMAATVVADKAVVDSARLNLNYSTVKSPVDGKTGPILIQIGNLVAANQTNPLVTIAQIHPVKVSFFLPQNDLPAIQQHMATGKMDATIKVEGNGGKTLSAPVDFVGNAVSNQTGTIELRATFPNLDNVLVPGQLVDTSVTLNEIDNATVVPHIAVNQGPDGNYLWRVTKDKKAEMVPVDVLYDDGAQSAVKGNVKPGDRVITVGALRVVDGTKVSVTKARPGEQQEQSPAGAQ
ncbi:MAG TPA: efflux RND transporter periplasmic adaptor subunit [Rhizomicrobium sp.]